MLGYKKRQNAHSFKNDHRNDHRNCSTVVAGNADFYYVCWELTTVTTVFAFKTSIGNKKKYIHDTIPLKMIL